jgi:hypothetical protein
MSSVVRTGALEDKTMRAGESSMTGTSPIVSLRDQFRGKVFYSESVMKKKALAEPVISPEILAMAKKSIETGQPAPARKCAVCGASCTPSAGPHAADDELCWVCRRLKISAWRDSDQQISAQE